MLVKLIEFERGSPFAGYSSRLKEVYVNSQHIVSVTEDTDASEKILSEAANLGLSSDVRFSKVIINEGSHSRSLLVVGKPSEVYNKIKKRQVLRG